MNITALAPDSKIPNLAIEKVKLYHRQRGDNVYDLDIFIPQSDIVYVSIIFDWSRPIGEQYQMYDQAQIGGSGWDIQLKLPPEIDAMRPKINLGFTSRGCNNNCPFCIVHQKEGNAKPEADLYDIWDGKAKLVTLLDNNILQLPAHFRLICSQARKEKIKVDFNQGLDHKLLTDEIVKSLKTIRHGELRFAFDFPTYFPTVKRAIDLLDKHGIHRAFWYVLVGYNTTLEQDLERINYLKSRNQTPYVMRFKTCNGKHIYTQLARWCNQPNMMRKMTFDEFLTL